jgi:hypothetical protein
MGVGVQATIRVKNSPKIVFSKHDMLPFFLM